MTTAAQPSRAPTPIDTIADAYVATIARLNPLAATEMGVDGFDHLMTDFSPAGWQAQLDAARLQAAKIVHANRARIERLAAVLVEEPILAGEALEAAIRRSGWPEQDQPTGEEQRSVA